MKSIHLTDAELAMVRNAVHGYLTTFGHNEADVVRQVKAVLHKLDQASDVLDEPAADATHLIGGPA